MCIRDTLCTHPRVNVCVFSLIYKIHVYITYHAAQPLVIDCDSSSSNGHVTIDCQTNRPPVIIMCSFDDGPQHECKL